MRIIQLMTILKQRKSIPRTSIPTKEVYRNRMQGKKGQNEETDQVPHGSDLLFTDYQRRMTLEGESSTEEAPRSTESLLKPKKFVTIGNWNGLLQETGTDGREVSRPYAQQSTKMTDDDDDDDDPPSCYTLERRRVLL